MIRYTIILLLVAAASVIGQDCPVDTDQSCLGCDGVANQPIFRETDTLSDLEDHICTVTLDWDYIDMGGSSSRMTFTCSYDDGSLCTESEIDVCASCESVTFTDLNYIRNPVVVYSDTCGNVDQFFIGENCETIPTTTEHPQGCTAAFEFIGGKCIFVDPFLNGNWNAVRFFCQQLGADLVIIDTDELFLDILDYIHENSIEGRNYWIGGYLDRLDDGQFNWIDGQHMELGTPYWATFGVGNNQYIQEPSDNSTFFADCIQMDGGRFLYYDDDDCNALKAAICEHSAS